MYLFTGLDYWTGLLDRTDIFLHLQLAKLFLLAESHKHEQQNHKYQLKILLLAIQHLNTPFTFYAVVNEQQILS